MVLIGTITGATQDQMSVRVPASGRYVALTTRAMDGVYATVRLDPVGVDSLISCLEDADALIGHAFDSDRDGHFPEPDPGEETA